MIKLDIVTNFIQLVSLQQVDQFLQTKLHCKAPNKGYLHICRMYKSNKKQLRYQTISVVATTYWNGTCSLLTSSKLSNGLSSSGDYKRTQQGALAALLLYLYKLLVVYATTILTCPYVYASSSCPITHPHIFFLRPPCFLHMPWCYTLNLHCTCAHHIYTMRNYSPLTSSLTLTPSRLFPILLDPKSFQTVLALSLSG